MPPNKARPWERHARQTGRPGHVERRRVLIVCEDSKSSRFYFEGFPVARERAIVKAVGTGMNTDSLIEEAVRLRDKAQQKGAPFSNVWCVFDRDSFPQAQHDRAFQLAKNNHFEVAWANEAFELWYLLHFQYLDTGISRAEFPSRLTKLMGVQYEKSDREIYSRLRGRQSDAIRNARNLLKAHRERGESPERNFNPSTNLHELVEFLNELCELEPVE
jgi:hypothetical protein